MYRLRQPKKEKNLIWVLNYSTEVYLGTINIQQRIFYPVKNPDEKLFQESNAFYWIFTHLTAGTLPSEMVAITPESCIRCSAELTDPISIALGIGPYCSGPAVRKWYRDNVLKELEEVEEK